MEFRLPMLRYFIARPGPMRAKECRTAEMYLTSGSTVKGSVQGSRGSEVVYGRTATLTGTAVEPYRA